jgi:hypothetical protein
MYFLRRLIIAPAAECALGDLKATVHENIAYPHRRGRNNGRHDPGDDGAHK